MAIQSKIKQAVETALGYSLFEDFGRYKEFYRAGNAVVKPTCGTFTVTSTTVTPMAGLLMEQITAEIVIAAQESALEQVKATINAYVQTNQGTAFAIAEEDKTYLATQNFSLAQVGEKSDAPGGTGHIFPITFWAYYTIIQNGVSSADVKISIDGLNAYFTSATFGRKRISETGATIDGAEQKATFSQNGFYIDFVGLMLDNALGDEYRKAIMQSGENTAHCVGLTIGGDTEYYIMHFGDMSATASGTYNVGCNVALVQAMESLARYDARWSKYTEDDDVAIAEKPTGAVSAIVFWGDGTASTVSDELAHVYIGGGTHTVRIFAIYASDEMPIVVGDYLFGSTLYTRLAPYLFMGASPITSDAGMLTIVNGRYVDTPFGGTGYTPTADANGLYKWVSRCGTVTSTLSPMSGESIYRKRTEVFSDG